MSKKSAEHIVIIGNGVSGITCARHLRKRSDDKITVISSETAHHFSRTALMYIYIGHMRFEDTKPYEDYFWKKNRLELVFKHVDRINTTDQKLVLADQSEITFDKLILAVGSKPNFFNWPGQNLKGVQGLFSYQDLKSMQENTTNIQQAVVVGGGLIGVEMVEMLLSRNIKTTFVIRENRFWPSVLSEKESRFIEAHLKSHHVHFKFSVELKEIQGEQGRVSSVHLSDGTVIPCQFAGITVGVSPAISFLKDSGIETDRGILINEFFETNVKNIYAIGDCAQFKNPLPGRRPLEQVWYTGKLHGETLANGLTGNRFPYNPGNWFNSAKFFDIEYQNYGDAPSMLKDDLTEFFWQHESGQFCVRVIFEKSTRRFIGINTFGIRMRHEVMDRWITENKSVDFVMEHLAQANFDPEFFRSYEREINQTFVNNHKEKTMN
ncbi:MAG: FAD-dependent oxidoreductase [Crocinitomicaceae bacterium]|nr:FAD-dependent oxidoreductase [Crocinitomicaceae bacterium]